jgi:hypothetical protein
MAGVLRVLLRLRVSACAKSVLVTLRVTDPNRAPCRHAERDEYTFRTGTQCAKGSGTVVRSTLRAVSATVPEPFSHRL